MPEIWFYHLMGQSMERALPILLERTLARGWRAVVEAADEERLQALDELLWTYSDETFLAHGRASDGDPDLQPIWLTCGPDNPNSAQVRFFVGGAPTRVDADQGYERIILMFDGADDEQVAAAREQWRALRNSGEGKLSYWRQAEDGRWTKMD
jgi:DNA polymerase III subunit chi